jgi:3-hydroxymyristoyl/3-hydroxydecanoyl-(acyl carrier protein) dehydratase
MRFVVDPAHPGLPGHFPGAPVVPGVVVLEHVLAAIEAAHGPLGALRMPQVKFLQSLLPGEYADVELADVVAEGEASRWRFRVLRGDALIASGEVASA